MALEPHQLLEMYRKMVTIRRFDETAVEEFQSGNIPGVVHAYIGQEAVAVGVCSALRHDDRIVSTHRGHGHTIAKGADLKLMMAELFGRSNGYCHGKGGCYWSTILSVANGSGKMSVHERTDIEHQGTEPVTDLERRVGATLVDA